MLKGSLQTVALPEVLNFLADTGKTGEFHVSGSHGGRLWFDQGRIAAIDVTRAHEPSEAIFELLRVDEGEFDFVADSAPSDDAVVVEGDAGAVAPALEVAQAKLAEWRDIVAVVPSLEHGLQLRAEAPAEVVTLEPEQWMMVVAIGAGRSVAEVIDARGLQEFDGCTAVRDLVEASLVEVVEPPMSTVEPVAEPAVEPLAEPVFATVEEPVFAAMEPPVSDGVEPVADDAVPADEPFTEAHVPQGDPDSGFSPFSFSDHGADPGGHGSQESDHYAALRAAMVEIGDDLVEVDTGSQYEESSHPVYEFHADPEMDGRAALQALLSEVTEDGSLQAVHDDSVDGLADRGPWTQTELSTMENEPESWSEAGHDVSNIVPFAPVHSPEDGSFADSSSGGESGEADAEGEPEDAEPAAEPINRGLLLKFLSSVRN